MTEKVKNMIIDSLKDDLLWMQDELKLLKNEIDNDSEFKHHLQTINDIMKRKYDATKLYIRWIDEDEETPFDPPYTIEES